MSEPQHLAARNDYHVLPVADQIDHERDDTCPCGPETQRIVRDDGSDAWLIIHHSLDGREHGE